MTKAEKRLLKLQAMIRKEERYVPDNVIEKLLRMYLNQEVPPTEQDARTVFLTVNMHRPDLSLRMEIPLRLTVEQYSLPKPA